MIEININGAAVDAAELHHNDDYRRRYGLEERGGKMTAYHKNLVYAGTRNLVEHTDYPKLADIRRGLRTGKLAIPRSHLITTGVLPEDYQTWNDFVDEYMRQEYGWQPTKSLHTCNTDARRGSEKSAKFAT